MFVFSAIRHGRKWCASILCGSRLERNDMVGRKDPSGRIVDL